jgi:Xaa-Pro aminopeptidase
MNIRNGFDRRCPTAILAVLVASLVVAASDVKALWQPAPPEPVISDSERIAELAGRRAAVARRIGSQGMLLLFSGESRVYAGDVDYPFRQENNLYYLTGINQEGISLMLVPGAKRTRELLFIPRRNPARETWTGHMMSAEEARARSGITEIWDASLRDQFITFLAPRVVLAEQGAEAKTAKPDEKQLASWKDDFRDVSETIKGGKAELYMLNPAVRHSHEYHAEQTFAAKVTADSGVTVKSAFPIFADLRVRKSPWEQRLLQHAVDISIEAFNRAYAVAAPGVSEYEVQAEFEYTYRRRHADSWGYPCIVGGGSNATTLHYETNQERLPSSGLLLMDCAAEYDHYSADVTRTIPIDGKFSPAEADIYRIVYEAQEKAIAKVRAGAFIGARRGALDANDSVHAAATEVVKDGLLRLGLITNRNSDQYRIWFMHGTSHFLGMNVHDVGNGGVPLAPGGVITVEPGIYIRLDALDVLPKTPENEKFIAAVRPAFEKYKGIGVRIEDDVLVTEGEPKVLSAALPRRLEDVETKIAQLRQDFRKSGGPNPSDK